MTAKLNEYSPGEARDWREVRRRLTGRVAYGQLNKKPLGGRVVVMPTFHDTGRLRSVAAEFGPTRTGSQRFLILGDPKGYIDRRDTRLQIGAGGPSLIVGSEVRDRLRDRFPIASAALERQRDAVLGLFLVEVQGVSGDILKRIRVIDGALTLLSWPSLVPVDSHHEALVANRLVDAERSFLKPMVIDSLLRMLPDFVLRDKVSREYVEVWGMDGEAYRERMEEKIARYDELNLKLIDWHAYRKEPMPDFGATATGTFSRQNATANQVLRRKKTRAERYPG